jgi:crossover junction endodeoxyribonuclease RuvC
MPAAILGQARETITAYPPAGGGDRKQSLWLKITRAGADKGEPLGFFPSSICPFQFLEVLLIYLKDMLILGIDPGTATTGYGLIEFSPKRLEVLDFGLIETDKNKKTAKRLENIYKAIMDLLKMHRPDVMVIEKIFFATNAKTAISVGQAQGVLLVAASKNNVEVAEFAPGTIKKVVAGDGRADKKAVQRSLRKVLGAKVRSKAKGKTHFDNAADALAVALCYAYTYKGGEKSG